MYRCWSDHYWPGLPSGEGRRWDYDVFMPPTSEWKCQNAYTYHGAGGAGSHQRLVNCMRVPMPWEVCHVFQELVSMVNSNGVSQQLDRQRVSGALIQPWVSTKCISLIDRQSAKKYVLKKKRFKVKSQLNPCFSIWKKNHIVIKQCNKKNIHIFGIATFFKTHIINVKYYLYRNVNSENKNDQKPMAALLFFPIRLLKNE